MRGCRYKLLYLLLSFATLLAGCATAPLSGTNISTSNEDETRAGNKQHHQILNEIGVYEDSKLAEYVQQIGQKIASVSERPNLNWKFTVLDSSIPNALALQGGYVYITRGLLAHLRSETDLAAVLAHEIAHVCAHDSVHAARRNEIAAISILLTAPAVIFFPPLAAPVGAGLAAFDRQAETNADQHGAGYLQRAGYPSEAMREVLDILKTIETYERNKAKIAGRNSPNSWHRLFFSHPDTDKRQEKLTTNSMEETVPVKAKAAGAEFLARLNGLEVSNVKIQGFPYGEKLYFQTWNLALKVPNGWDVWFNRGDLWIVRIDNKARMKIEPAVTVQSNHEICESLAQLFSNASLSTMEPVPNRDLPSCSAIARETFSLLFSSRTISYRVGVFESNDASELAHFLQNKRVFFKFQGYADQKEFSTYDLAFLTIASSIEFLKGDDRHPKPPKIRIQRAKVGDTFSKLAQTSPIRNDPENFLRVLNNRYPHGEPIPGELIKVVEQQMYKPTKARQ